MEATPGVPAGGSAACAEIGNPKSLTPGPSLKTDMPWPEERMVIRHHREDYGWHRDPGRFDPSQNSL